MLVACVARIAASISRWTVASSIVVENVKASASRGCGDGVRLWEALRRRSLAISRSPPGGSWRNSWDADVLVCLRVDGRFASSGVAGVISGAGVAGAGVGVAALLQKNDMKRKRFGLPQSQLLGKSTNILMRLQNNS